MYSRVMANVLPEPAEALYIVSPDKIYEVLGKGRKKIHFPYFLSPNVLFRMCEAAVYFFSTHLLLLTLEVQYLQIS